MFSVTMVAYVPHYFGIFVSKPSASAGPLALVKCDRSYFGLVVTRYHINDLNRRFLKAFKGVYMERKSNQNFMEKYGLLNGVTNEEQIVDLVD